MVVFVLVCPENLMVKRLHGIAGISSVKTVSIQHLQGVQHPADGHPWKQTASSERCQVRPGQHSAKPATLGAKEARGALLGAELPTKPSWRAGQAGSRGHTRKDVLRTPGAAPPERPPSARGGTDGGLTESEARASSPTFGPPAACGTCCGLLALVKGPPDLHRSASLFDLLFRLVNPGPNLGNDRFELACVENQ